tara:strand:+ start:213 stop:353 length:141 start_codon:yes stop_codon:yes gene_type:complete
METVTLPTQLFNAILQYLGSQPYAQVFPLIQAIEKELAPKETENGS